jgi:hypothetical protein
VSDLLTHILLYSMATLNSDISDFESSQPMQYHFSTSRVTFLRSGRSYAMHPPSRTTQIYSANSSFRNFRTTSLHFLWSGSSPELTIYFNILSVPMVRIYSSTSTLRGCSKHLKSFRVPKSQIPRILVTSPTTLARWACTRG